mgnify:FL=1
MTRIYPFFLALFLALGTLPAQEPPAPVPVTEKGPETPVVIREQTVYVPYTKLKDVFEKEGRGIFLPYEEFLKLWRAANPTPNPVEPVGPPAEAVVQSSPYKGKVIGDLALFEVSYHVEALKEGWGLVKLPLSGVAVESVDLGDSKALFATHGKSYGLLLPEKGPYDLKLRFSVKVQSSPGIKKLSFGLPPAGITSLELAIPEADARVDVTPKTAATRITAAGEETLVTTFVGNSSNVEINWMPPIGKAAEDAAVLIAKQYARAYLGERILSLETTIQYDLARGEAPGFKLNVPTIDNTRLLYVRGDNIRRWDLEGSVLTVELHSPVKETYSLKLGFERVLPETPEAISVPVPRAEGVLRESGWLALGHDSGLKVNISSSTGYSQLDLGEVPKSIGPDSRVGFQYLAPPEPLGLSVRKIEPVIHSEVISVVTLGRERDSWVGEINYRIKKAGVFIVALAVPERWSVEEVGSPQDVEDFQISDPDSGLRTITVNLRARQLGAFKLPFKLTAEGSIGEEKVTLSPLFVTGTQQDQGLFGVAAPRSIDLKTVAATGLSSVEQQELVSAGIMSQVSAEAGEPLAYRYSKNSLTEKASVELELREKQEEINVISQHLAAVGESGRIKLTHYLDYMILYKERDSLEFTAPSTLDSELRINGEGIAETPVPEPQDNGLSLWTVKLQSPVQGTVTLSITHEISPEALESGKASEFTIPLVYPRKNFKTRSGFVAVTKVGNLEVETSASNLDTIDSSRLDPRIGRRGQVIKAYAYSTKDPELKLSLTRYNPVPLAETAVTLHHIKAVLSRDPCKLHAIATLLVQNSSAQYLEISLPEGASLRNVFVNGAPATTKQRKDGGTDLISIPRSKGREAFAVVVDYDQSLSSSPMGSLGGLEIETISIKEAKDKPVPVQKIEFDLWVPDEFSYLSWSGNLNRRGRGHPTAFSRLRKLIASPFNLPEADSPHKDPADFSAEDAFRRETQGKAIYSFSCMARTGSLGLSWTTPSILGFTKVLFFAATLIGGSILMRKLSLNPGWTSVNFTWVPLIPAWFLDGPAAETFSAAFFGGVALLLLTAARRLKSAYSQWRLERIALAPDPYLEDTEDQPDPEVLQEDDLAEKAPKKKKSGASRKKSGRSKKAD